MRIDTKPYLREVSLKRDRITNYNYYPFNIPAVRELRRIRFHPDVTFIVGENGCGKSTLLEAIAVAWGFNPEGGSINFRFSTWKEIVRARCPLIAGSHDVQQRIGHLRKE